MVRCSVKIDTFFLVAFSHTNNIDCVPHRAKIIILHDVFLWS